MKITLSVLQAVLLLAMAPLVRGIIARVKARFQNRRGATVFRPYQDLVKLFRKEDLIPPAASVLFRVAPIVVLTSLVMASFFVPVIQDSTLLGMSGDFVILIYLLALSRFFLMLGGMDSGSSFGGMGASREALVSTLAETPLMLGLTAVFVASRTTGIAGATHWTLQQDITQFSAIHALAFVALALVAVAETGRIPVDNPTTHLELTMIHEAMVLEYSGPSLAFFEWASALKLTLVSALLIGLFAPWGMAATGSTTLIAIALGAFLLKILLLVLILALVESGVAKLRMYLVPDFLGVASALAILAIVFAGMTR